MVFADSLFLSLSDALTISSHLCDDYDGCLTFSGTGHTADERDDDERQRVCVCKMVDLMNSLTAARERRCARFNDKVIIQLIRFLYGARHVSEENAR